MVRSHPRQSFIVSSTRLRYLTRETGARILAFLWLDIRTQPRAVIARRFEVGVATR